MQNAFNFNAEKTVKWSEFKQKLKALYKTELTFGEKVYMHTLDNISSLVASAALISDYFKGLEGVREILPANDTKGFVNGRTMSIYGEYDLACAFNKRICRKTWELGVKAFDQCQACTPPTP